MELIELFVIDDHAIFIEGISKAFSEVDDKIFVGEFALSVADARKKLKQSRADVILLDLMLPDESGATFCLELKNTYPDKKIIILTGETDENILHTAWMNNADAIVMKTIGKVDLISVIKEIIKGGRRIGPNVPPFFENRIIAKNQPFLTKKEQQVINLLVIGKTRKQASLELGISSDTVNKHCTHVFRKFKVDSLQNFILKARDMKIIK